MTVRLLDPSGDADPREVDLTDRDAGALILALQAELGDRDVDLGRLTRAVDRLLKAIDELGTTVGLGTDLGNALGLLTADLRSARRRVSTAGADTDLDPRTGYPPVPALDGLLDLALDGEGYREHVLAHVLPRPSDPHPFTAADPAATDCDICYEGRGHYLHDEDRLEPGDRIAAERAEAGR